MSKTIRVFRICGCCLLTASIWYVATYVLMMDWRRPAFDPVARHFVDQSAYRCAPIIVFNLKSSDLPNIIMVEPCVCWANRVFWPIDLLTCKGTDSSLIYEDTDAVERPLK